MYGILCKVINKYWVLRIYLYFTYLYNLITSKLLDWILNYYVSICSKQCFAWKKGGYYFKEEVCIVTERYTLIGIKRSKYLKTWF